MTKCSFAELSDRGVIKIAGSDAHKLLQDIVTNDITLARDGHAVHAALLTPQGKILFDFFLLDKGDVLLMECDRESTTELIKRLTFYKLRADVAFEDISSNHAIWAAWGDCAMPDSSNVGYADPRHTDLGLRLICDAGATPKIDGKQSFAADYHAHRINLGIPEGRKDYPFGDTFPHEADYDLLKGVDFKKGCFVGQEVVSRMEHRGTARKRIVPVSGVSGVLSGTEITAGEASIGLLGSVAGDRGLAMVRLDRATKAIEDGRQITAGETPISFIQPDWANFTVPAKG